MHIELKNSFVGIKISLTPFFRIDSFTDLKSGRNMLSTGEAQLLADRKRLGDFQLTDTR